MRLSILLAPLSVSAIAISVPQKDYLSSRRCGASITPYEIAAAEAAFSAASAQLKVSEVFNATIPIYWHVICAGDAISEGNISDSQIEANLDVINKDYSASGVRYALEGITRTANASWFANAGPQTSLQADMKKELRQGGANALNIYTVGFRNGPSRGLLGYSTFPSAYQGAPQDDGVVILYSTVPGGDLPKFNLGKTLTHEVGHWVGLYHTFEGGCLEPGDYVDDTPPEALPSFGCPASKHTCTSPGMDLVHNFMDYADDDCMSEFTSGQIARMVSQISTYRLGP
ncbi:hypothetical protein BOTBODRAFT_38539 [Botryobasidium botryosum FD-172 SS1]|uniref:Peptidase M43 pregnancy-associated plasma-A domain-containing protein n=1 Tax=Botryobasidium botryosum (strain FD-172 SS1) TaxID=930990 RepID=A0A067LWJ9_BOTB1|nr:hypothetical protein BOTBODRAFT_38539 [Botryobasidium botryosum FD-172 SS1]